MLKRIHSFIAIEDPIHLIYRCAVVGSTLLAAAGALSCARGRGGVQFIVENAGSSSLDSAIVFAGGNAFELSTVAPGDTATVLTRSYGEAHFEIEHGPAADRRRLNLGGYFEGGYTGTFRVRMTRDSVLAVDNRIALPY